MGKTPLDLRVPPGEYNVAVFDGGNTWVEEQVLVSAGGDKTVRVGSPGTARHSFDVAVLTDQERVLGQKRVDGPSSSGGEANSSVVNPGPAGPGSEEDLPRLDSDSHRDPVHVESGEPIVLSTDASFWEPSGNKALDAGETGTITITIRNTGDAEVSALRPRLTAQYELPGLELQYELLPGLELGPADTVAALVPGATTTVQATVTAAANLRDARAYLTVEVQNDAGEDVVSSASLSFETVSAFVAEQRRAACAGAFSQAETSFYEALYEDAAEALQRCLSMGGFVRDEQVRAYTLLAKVYLDNGARQDAVASLRDLIAMVTDYSPDPLHDRPDFVRLVEQTRDDMEREAAMEPIERVLPQHVVSVPPLTPGIIAPRPVESPDLSLPAID
jgi:hypothetical protein